MTTAVQPESTTEQVAAEKKVRLPIKQMVVSELAALKQFYDTNRGASKPRVGMQLFVTNAFRRHEKLIRMWGGWRCHTLLSGIKGSEPTISTDQYHQIIANIQRRNPNGYGYGMPLPPWGDYVQHRTAPREMIVYVAGRNVKIRQGQVVARPILTTIRKDFLAHPNYVKTWEFFFQSLGELYVEKDYKHVLTVSVSPSDWMHLGHVAGASCYSTNGGHEYSKIRLAQLSNTAVVYLWRTDTDELPGPNDPWPIHRGIARCWLRVAPRLGFFASNAYGKAIRPMIDHLTKASENWLGVKLVNPNIRSEPDYGGVGIRNTIDYHNHGVYINGDSHVVGPYNEVGFAIAPRGSLAYNHFKQFIKPNK